MMKPATFSRPKNRHGSSHLCLRLLFFGALTFLLSSSNVAAAPNFQPSAAISKRTSFSHRHRHPKLSNNSRHTPVPRGGATVTPTVFNIVKSIVGAGVLGLPAGIAAFGNHPSALLPATALLIGIGCLAARGFVTIGTVCSHTQATSYQQAWSRSVSEDTAWLPTTACTLVTTFAVLCYSMILRDTIPALAESLLGVVLPKEATLVTFTGMVLLPLCLMRTLSKLAPFSLLGILGMVYTCTIMLVRWGTGAYSGTGALATAATV